MYINGIHRKKAQQNRERCRIDTRLPYFSAFSLQLGVKNCNKDNKGTESDAYGAQYVYLCAQVHEWSREID